MARTATVPKKARVPGERAKKIAAYWALAKSHMEKYCNAACRELNSRGLPRLSSTYATCRESTGGPAPNPGRMERYKIFLDSLPKTYSPAEWNEKRNDIPQHTLRPAHGAKLVKVKKAGKGFKTEVRLILKLH
jgi:hypothetical protein